MKARLVFGLSLSCLGAMFLPQSEAAAALSANYPTVNSSNPHLLKLRFEYVGIAGLGTNTTPANGWFRLASTAGDPLNGGWLKVTAMDQNAPARGEIPAKFAYFPIAIEYASGWN